MVPVLLIVGVFDYTIVSLVSTSVLTLPLPLPLALALALALALSLALSFTLLPCRKSANGLSDNDVAT